eukprot:COSAG01_NODE_14_length_41020_cov_40.702133_16_plen_64_part_00
MNNQTDKERWKKEAKRLKKDLDSRQKIIKKREVAIKLLGSKDKKIIKQNKTNIDDQLRHQLGI